MERIEQIAKVHAAQSVPDSHVFNAVMALMERYGAEEVEKHLPPSLREPFIAWARQNYDNDKDPDDFVWLWWHSEEPPNLHALIVALRAWFGRLDASKTP